MSVINTGSIYKAVLRYSGSVRVILLFLCCAVIEPLVAQLPEPGYQFEFIPRETDGSSELQSGILQVQILPPPLHQRERQGGVGVSQVPALLSLDATFYSGTWLVDDDSNTLQSEPELLVQQKFQLFQNADQVEQYERWLDPETYATFSESVLNNEIDLATDREFYRQYDNIRLLASVRYGGYTLLYTQFKAAGSGELTSSVMPARIVEGRLVTAGSLHASSHELYRLLAFGTLQQRLMEFLETRVRN